MISFMPLHTLVHSALFPFFVVVGLLTVQYGEPSSAAAQDQAQADEISDDQESEVRVSFNRDIRPILSNHCYQCHGPDEENVAADLRLDMADGIDQAFAPGDLDNSEGWFRIVSKYDDERMPPPEANVDLTDEQIQLIGRWIEQGAEWQDHWSFSTPTKAPLPSAATDPWVNSPIDAFVLDLMRQHGLEPTPRADRARLLRRVTFDLTGMPATPAEIDAFLSDESDDAYERVVDRLLSSERYGERMALFWMDAARYGDTSVFHADGPRDMWPWRDWVIRSFNNNIPFDQFTIEQLAGDLLPDPTWEQLTASGFNRNHGTTDEGGAIDEEYRVEYAVDRVKTTATVWLGLTLECAQCHDHKYDPFTQQDYYQFFAYFNQSVDRGMQTRNGNAEPKIDIPNEQNYEKLASTRTQLTALEEKMALYRDSAGDRFQQWVDVESAKTEPRPEFPSGQIAYWNLDLNEGNRVPASDDNLEPGTIHGKADWIEGKTGRALRFGGNNFVDLGDVGNFDRTDSFSFGAWIWYAKNSNGAPIAKMFPGNQHRGYDIHMTGGKVEFHLIHNWPNNAIKVSTKTAFAAEEWHHVCVTYDGSSDASGVKIYVDGENQEWDIQQNGLTGSTLTEKPLYLGRRNSGSQFKGQVDEVRFFERKLEPTEVGLLTGFDPIGDILRIASDERTEVQQETLRTHFLNQVDPEYPTMVQNQSQLKAAIKELEKPLSTVMVMRDEPKGRMTYVLKRGQYDAPLTDHEVQPKVLERILPLADGAPANRLGLARWIVADDHPLTSRVTVNRFWQILFGVGLVRSSGDFGAQGESPSHPELLDWLAADFVENGWDVKRTLKQIVMSSTYRQSSRSDARRREVDPENTWLSRGPRFRLQGEFIRDQALAISGLLVEKVGGPGVKPYQPAGLWNEVSLSGNVRFVQDHGDKLYRRSMYTYWKRSAPAPSLIIFDTPTREQCVVQRSRTNTPLQALVTLNDTQFVEAARMLAERMLCERPDDRSGQLEFGYRLATGVKPSERVMGILERAYNEEHEHYAANPEQGAALLATGESPRDETLDQNEHAAMTIVASIILNLDETLTKN